MSNVAVIDQNGREIDAAPILTPMTMIDRAVSSGASIETLERLMALQERYERNEARKAFEAAVASAKAEIPVITKNRHVGFESKRTESKTDYWHEDLGEIARTIDPILGKYGLSYRYRAKQDGAKLRVTCVLAHANGYFEETELEAGNDTTGNKNAHQGVGSAATYLQRYTLKLALGLAAAKDDDGKAASGPELVTEDQVLQLIEMIEAVDADRAKFCKFLKVDTLADLAASRFDAAMKALAEHGERNK